MKKTIGNIFVGLMYLILYLPLLVMVVFSFNAGSSTSVFKGLSFKWYVELFTNSTDVGVPVRNTLMPDGSMQATMRATAVRSFRGPFPTAGAASGL